ncbi:hypothetical protein BH10ACT3_BH10ACT3_00400 [soil metagenome]
MALPLAVIIAAGLIYGGVRAAGLVDPDVPETDRAVGEALERDGLDCPVDDNVYASDGRSLVCTDSASADSSGGRALTVDIDADEDGTTVLFVSGDALAASGPDLEDLLTEIGTELGWDADTSRAMLATELDSSQSAGRVSWYVRDDGLHITVKD